MAKVLCCDIVVGQFELQSRYYIHFQIYTIEKSVKPLFR